MSLVKKALKDAENARSKNATPYSGPELMTVDHPPRAGYSNFALMALIAAVMTLSGIMTWKWFRAGDHEMKVRARSYDSVPNPPSAPQPQAVQAAPAPASEVVASKDAAKSAEPASTVEENPPVIIASSLPVVAPPKPPAFSYKLQGITYAPGHSSVVINGKTVMAGERVDGALILKVTKDTVTLVNPRGETNLLELL